MAETRALVPRERTRPSNRRDERSEVPKLWSGTIEAHRRAVRNATLDATAALVTEHGLRSVTMSQIAEDTGIGRATLYKYFSSVEAILVAWHERHLTSADLASLLHRGTHAARAHRQLR